MPHQKPVIQGRGPAPAEEGENALVEDVAAGGKNTGGKTTDGEAGGGSTATVFAGKYVTDGGKTSDTGDKENKTGGHITVYQCEQKVVPVLKNLLGSK